MSDKLRGLLDRNVITGLALGSIAVAFLVAAVAAVLGHYDSASVRAFIDDIKYLAAALGLSAGIGRGLIAAGQRVADGRTEAALVLANPTSTASTTPPPEAEVPSSPPVQPSQSGLT